MALLLCAALPVAPEDGEVGPSSESINRAIDEGVAWLRSAQKEDGSWGPCIGGNDYEGGPGGFCYRLGPTAFSVFTLATCGVHRDDATIARAREWIEKSAGGDYLYTSYESAALVLMYCALHQTEPPSRQVRTRDRRRPPARSRFPAGDWRAMDERVQHLLDCMQEGGGFGYWAGTSRYTDVSATQFAILALRAASLAGYPVEKSCPEVWIATLEFLRKLQRADGGFPYHKPHKSSRGMTAAALSTLLLCREQMGLLREEVPEYLDEVLAKGFAYLDANLDVAENPSDHFEGRSHYHYCHLYAIERTGILSGRREFGGKSWYARGARFLLAEQSTKGSWRDGTCMRPKDTLGTCFALLFLKKATIPAITLRRAGR